MPSAIIRSYSSTLNSRRRSAGADAGSGCVRLLARLATIPIVLRFGGFPLGPRCAACNQYEQSRQTAAGAPALPPERPRAETALSPVQTGSTLQAGGSPLASSVQSACGVTFHSSPVSVVTSTSPGRSPTATPSRQATEGLCAASPSDRQLSPPSSLR